MICFVYKRLVERPTLNFLQADSRYKYFSCGNDEGTCGVGILLAEKWWEKVFEVIRVSDRIILIRMVVGSVVFVFVSVYAPQSNLSESVKDQSYYSLQSTIARVSSSEQLIISGEWNGHIGSHSTAFEDMHGGQALGKRNHEGERLLEFVVANELVVGNSWFKKKFEYLVTYQSGECKTKIDYILYKRSFKKMVSNVKVIVGEECATQHRLVVGDFKVCTHAHPKRFVPYTKVWKLTDFGNQIEISNVFNALIQGNETGKTLDELWKYLKNNLINATKQVCGVSAKHTWKR